MFVMGVPTESNYFIFVDRIDNFRITAKHLVYGANIARPEHRALCNVKPGDIVFVYVMEERSLYGPFVAESRLFEDHSDIGWRVEGKTADWPHRVPFRPWMSRIGILDKYSLLHVYRQIRGNLFTLRDIDDLHRRYLNTLVNSEGVVLFKEFLKHAIFKKPTDVCPDFGSNPIRMEPLNAKKLLRAGMLSEYVIELYLLQNYNKLGELVGFGFTEVYNQLYVYQNRFLDLLTIHKMGDEPVKATVVEIKKKPILSPDEMRAATEALGHYIATVADWFNLHSNAVQGILLTPEDVAASSLMNDLWQQSCSEIIKMYGIPPHALLWVQYRISSEFELEFT